MASSSRHSESDKGKEANLPPKTPQFSEFPTQESHTDGRESFSKVDGCEYEHIESENYSVEKFMVDGKHFSHHHPLSLTKDKQGDDDEDEDDKDYLCRICGLQILSTPSYTCAIACKIFLHKECALKFPPKFIHRTHAHTFGGRHTFYIRKGTSSPNFTYKCEDCDYEIHPLVARVPHVEIKINHKSHPSHPLMAICKEISCECDACGKKQDGFFFSCVDCNFWIHQDCTILPDTITLLNHPYPFLLAYSLPFYQTEGSCVICREPLVDRHNGVYFCPQSHTFAHLPCGTDKCGASKTRLELIQLPDDEWDAFPTSVIRRYAESNLLALHAYCGGGAAAPAAEELTIEKYHNHPLILTQLTTTTKPCNLACDICTRPVNAISSLFYKCDDCHFVAHKICADILPILNFVIPGGLVGKFYADPSSFYFNSIFLCHFCHRPCNGVCYYFPEFTRTPYCIDLECMAAPSTINHASHPQHLLFRDSFLSARNRLTCCPNGSLLYDVYRCIICDYSLHIRCAMLPKRILYHEYHHHPLYLVFNNGQESSCSCFCEVCEEDIDLNYWLYRCVECEQSFHINCIPSVGYLSKVKFGGTVNVPECHIHPLSLTRMLTLPSQRCGHCKKIIQGLVDQIALFCSLCHFWLHFSCARNAGSNTLLLYSDIDEDKLIRMMWGELTNDYNEWF